MHQEAAFSADAYFITLEQFKGCHEKEISTDTFERCYAFVG
jgi:hypothetical protein